MHNEVWGCAEILPSNQLFENIFENYCIFNNYRPVLVLSSASKIFEKCIFNQLMSYLTDEDMTSSKQYGFRSG